MNTAPVHWLPADNTTAETVPSHALVRVTGVTGGILQVAQPNADGDTKVAVVSDILMPPSKSGEVTYQAFVVAAYDPADGVPAVGEQWGAGNGSWLLRKNKAGFRVLGGSGNGLVNVVREAGSGFTNSTSYADLSSAYSITANTTWEDTGLSLALPDAGTYWLAFHACGEGQPDVAGAVMQTRIYNVTASAVLDGTYTVFPQSSAVGSAFILKGNVAVQLTVTVTAATTYRVEAFRSTATWTVSQIYNRSYTRISYVKLY